jgi:hypothetical protein
MEFDISFANKEITPWGGLVFLKRMLEKIRAWFTGLWNYSDTFEYPFQFSTA